MVDFYHSLLTGLSTICLPSYSLRVNGLSMGGLGSCLVHRMD